MGNRVGESLGGGGGVLRQLESGRGIDLPFATRQNKSRKLRVGSRPFLLIGRTNEDRMA